MYETQSSSKARLKNDTLGDSALTELYREYDRMLLEEFREYCKDVVRSGGGNKPRKDEICNAIDSTQNKGVMLKKAQDFILAGMGLGV